MRKVAFFLALVTLVTSLVRAENWKLVKVWHKTFEAGVEDAAVSVDSAGNPIVTVSEMEKLWRVDAAGNQVLVKSVGRTPYFSSNGKYIYVRAAGEEALIDRDGHTLGKLTRKLPAFQTRWSPSYLPRPEVSNQGYLVGRLAADTLLFFNPQGRFLRSLYPGYQTTRDFGDDVIPKSRFSWDGSRLVVRLGERRRFLFLDQEGNQVGLSDSIMMGAYAIASNGDIWVIGGDTRGLQTGRLFGYYIDRDGKTNFRIDLGEVNNNVSWGTESGTSRFGEYAFFNCSTRLYVVQKSPPALKSVIVTGKLGRDLSERFWEACISPTGQWLATIYRTKGEGNWLRLYALEGSIQDEVKIAEGYKVVSTFDGEYFAFLETNGIDLYRVEGR